MSRAWIVLKDESVQEVPRGMAELSEIYWPPTLSEKLPGEPVAYVSERDLYERHLLQPEGIPVFVEYQRDPNALPERVNREIRERTKQASVFDSD
jgi:hypothetical protein